MSSYRCKMFKKLREDAREEIMKKTKKKIEAVWTGRGPVHEPPANS